MAALASSAVTVLKATNLVALGAPRLTTKRLTIVLTGQGGGTNTIGATALGFTSFVDCSNAITSDDGFIFPASVSYDGATIRLIDVSNATDATRDVPSDIPSSSSLTVRITVTGYTA